MNTLTLIQEWFPNDDSSLNKLIHDVQWVDTSLGEASSWPDEMKTALQIIKDSASPVALICGKEYFLFANEHFLKSFNQLPVNRTSMRAPDFFGEYWEKLQPYIDQVILKNEPDSITLENSPEKDSKKSNHKIIISPWKITMKCGLGVMMNLSEGMKDINLFAAGYNEEKYRIAIASAQIGTFDWNIKTGSFLFSELMARLFGYSDHENLTNLDFIKRIHNDDLELRRLAHKRAMETGSLEYEPRVVWPDGSVHWLKINGKIFFDDEGKPYHMFGTAIDITNQVMQTELLEKKVEERTISLLKKNEELKRSEERYHKMIEEVQDYVIIQLDRNGNILNWNMGAEKIKGYRDSEIVGKNFSIFYLEEDKKNRLPQTLINTAAENGRAMHEGYRVRKDGTTFWGSSVITALHDERGNVIGFTKVTRDLTERKKAEDRLKAYTNELEFQNRELEQFAYIASHDLQEPLRKIHTFIDLLRKNLDNKELAIQYYEKIRSSSQRMSDLINAILNYSRISAVRSGFVPVSLNQILTEVKTDFELLVEEKQARIIHDVLPEIPAIPLQVRQLFSNLIGNALKFTDRNPEIRISASFVEQGKQIAEEIELPKDKTFIELVVSDNGIGFEQVYASQIFTIFQRLHSKQQYAGTGIGLALCKRIAENHDGYITARSEPGKGASFIIYLPQYRDR